jgi:hypothetical protein
LADIFDMDNDWVCSHNLSSGTWYTPLILHGKPSGTVTITQKFYTSSQFGRSKGYSFKYNGAYYSSTGNWTALDAVGNLAIHSNGTAILATYMVHRQFFGNDCLNSVKVSWT